MEKEQIKLKISDIVPYKKNARKNDDAVKYVVASIKDCGYIAPIIIDENNVVLCGHTRLKALKQLDYQEVDVIKVSGLTEEQKKKYRLLDNKTSEFAEWDFDLLTEELKDLKFDFDFKWNIDNNISDYTEIKDTTYEEPKEKSIFCPYCNGEIKL